MIRHVKIAVVEQNSQVASLYASYFRSRGYDVQQSVYLEGVAGDTAVVIGEPNEVQTTVFVETFRATPTPRWLSPVDAAISSPAHATTATPGHSPNPFTWQSCRRLWSVRSVMTGRSASARTR